MSIHPKLCMHILWKRTVHFSNINKLQYQFRLREKCTSSSVWSTYVNVWECSDLNLALGEISIELCLVAFYMLLDVWNDLVHYQIKNAKKRRRGKGSSFFSYDKHDKKWCTMQNFFKNRTNLCSMYSHDPLLTNFNAFYSVQNDTIVGQSCPTEFNKWQPGARMCGGGSGDFLI